MTELRCRICRKWLANLSDDFIGFLFAFCRSCRQYSHDVRLESEHDKPLLKLRCECERWLATGYIVTGQALVPCRTCRRLTSLSHHGATSSRYSRPASDATIASMVEERWALMNRAKRTQRGAMAVGLRFDVFNRDGFRCRYCGLDPDQGALLEVDHIVPRSAGGTDDLSNLATSCWECNRGKSAKSIDVPDVMRIESM